MPETRSCNERPDIPSAGVLVEDVPFVTDEGSSSRGLDIDRISKTIVVLKPEPRPDRPLPLDNEIGGGDSSSSDSF